MNKYSALFVTVTGVSDMVEARTKYLVTSAGMVDKSIVDCLANPFTTIECVHMVMYEHYIGHNKSGKHTAKVVYDYDTETFALVDKTHDFVDISEKVFDEDYRNDPSSAALLRSILKVVANILGW